MRQRHLEVICLLDDGGMLQFGVNDVLLEDFANRAKHAKDPKDETQYSATQPPRSSLLLVAEWYCSSVPSAFEELASEHFRLSISTQLRDLDVNFVRWST